MDEFDNVWYSLGLCQQTDKNKPVRVRKQLELKSNAAFSVVYRARHKKCDVMHCMAKSHPLKQEKACQTDVKQLSAVHLLRNI